MDSVGYLCLGLLQFLTDFLLLLPQHLVCLDEDAHSFCLLHQLVVLSQRLGSHLKKSHPLVLFVYNVFLSLFRIGNFITSLMHHAKL